MSNDVVFETICPTYSWGTIQVRTTGGTYRNHRRIRNCCDRRLCQ